jgi:hypothetical protein
VQDSLSSLQDGQSKLLPEKGTGSIRDKQLIATKEAGGRRAIIGAKKAANIEFLTNIVQSFGMAWLGHPRTFQALPGFALLFSAFGRPYL